MSYLNDLTIIIVTYRTNKEILFNCIDSIDSNVKILVIENSSDNEFKTELEKKYSNISVILANKNLGYGAGNNLGFKNSIFFNDKHFIIKVNSIIILL